jgi:hypothetical protein
MKSAHLLILALLLKPFWLWANQIDELKSIAEIDSFVHEYSADFKQFHVASIDEIYFDATCTLVAV